MLAKKQTTRSGGVQTLLNDPQIRRAEHERRTVYSVQDVVRALTGSEHPAEMWEDLKRREPALAAIVLDADEFEGVDLAGVFRLVQSIDSPRADRLKNWLAQNAFERLEEAEDPELAILRTRQSYEQQGYSRQWIDQRMRSVSARHELTGEWYRRGVRESEEFRALTNEMMLGAFGMDVESYRRYKGLFRTGQNLRDHMTDMELALVALSESAAVELARTRRSSGFEALLLDAKETGQIIARTRDEIERRTGRPVVSAMNHLSGTAAPRRRDSLAAA
jgi:hypothetical protein